MFMKLLMFVFIPFWKPITEKFLRDYYKISFKVTKMQ